MFTHNFEEKKTGEASIKDITAGTFNKLLEYIYTGEVSDLNSFAEDLLKAADKYEILLLKEMCEISLCKTLNHDNAVRRMDLADMHDAPYLIDYIIKCIMRDPLKIIPAKGSYHYSNYQLVEDFKELYKTRAFSDMVINVGEEKLQAHRIILMTRSPVLASMFNQEMSEKKVNEVVITDISSDTFEKLLEYIYTDEVSDLEEDAAELLKAADKYQLASLKKRCKESLCKSLNPENALKMLDLADRFSAPYLMEYVTKCITADEAKIVESEEFKEYEKSNPSLGLRLFKELAVARTCCEAGIRYSTL
ncbi:Similar to spop: Speckle-type POZ protein (Xenopus tropicalis) [Cotesia congregata]|uniref:Similar to spop: Speckle-type POZ protein (Xenopus tropicalis) n=1 Tax=Cotesia congregata TaxID=51543 RepID=A0A8J2MQ79_COTCN|nr:Similar to spop: Speckle-type POZ protein (Xenopus tropicalis) [Cotesia congregata]